MEHHHFSLEHVSCLAIFHSKLEQIASPHALGIQTLAEKVLNPPKCCKLYSKHFLSEGTTGSIAMNQNWEKKHIITVRLPGSLHASEIAGEVACQVPGEREQHAGGVLPRERVYFGDVVTSYVSTYSIYIYMCISLRLV